MLVALTKCDLISKFLIPKLFKGGFRAHVMKAVWTMEM